MASGDTLAILTWHDAAFLAVAGTPAGFARRNGHMTIAFDDTATESVHFESTMPQNYSQITGLTILIYWMAATATTGDAIWRAAFERHEDDNFDLDGDGFGTAVDDIDTTASVAGELSIATIVHANGVETDDVEAGESYRLKITRAIGEGDTMTGDAQVVRVEIRET